jgi:hypothetical protein
MRGKRYEGWGNKRGWELRDVKLDEKWEDKDEGKMGREDVRKKRDDDV